MAKRFTSPAGINRRDGMQMKPYRIGTRGSPLALAQAHQARDRLIAAHGLSEEDFEIVVLSTQGDRIIDRSLSEIGGKGLFTFELEEQLADGLEREDVRDAFIGKAAETLAGLPDGAVVGTSSLRRQALVKRLRPDISVVGFRGQVETRLRKLDEGQADATLLAYAGLRRLGRPEIATAVMDPDDFPPAPGQGIICIETRLDDARIRDFLAPINHADSATALACERAFLAVLDGSCRTPIAAYARIDGAALAFHGMVLTPDGATVHEIRLDGMTEDAVNIGHKAGEDIRARAGAGFFESWT